MNHTPFKATDLQKQNLVALALRLEAAQFPLGMHFDMGDFDSNFEAELPNEADVAHAYRDGLEAGVPEERCGTSVCALGYAKYLFPKEYAEFQSWMSFGRETFGLKHGTPAWSWCFSGQWDGTDNTPLGAAQRIRYMLRWGIPDDWGKQLEGDAPLSYKEIMV